MEGEERQVLSALLDIFIAHTYYLQVYGAVGSNWLIKMNMINTGRGLQAVHNSQQVHLQAVAGEFSPAARIFLLRQQTLYTVLLLMLE